jgi:predicted ATPase
LTVDNVEIVAEICCRLDGIALAIELAAARIHVLSPRQIRGKLDERFRLLVGSDRAALPRQKTLRALVDWSYDLLTLEEKQALRHLSVFAGSFTLDAAEAVFGEFGEAVAIDLLGGLVDKSLLSAAGDGSGGDMRYQLLESIRAYALERAAEAGEMETIERRAFLWANERTRTISTTSGPHSPGRSKRAATSPAAAFSRRSLVASGVASPHRKGCIG